MSNLDWPDLVGLVIVGTPAIIAAISSLRNGANLKKINGGLRPTPAPKKPGVKRPKKNGQHPDWFKPPDLS
jgi:hypothetical protein